MDTPPFVGLIIFDYDRAQSGDERWRREMEKLHHGAQIKHAGDPKNIKLRCN